MAIIREMTENERLEWDAWVFTRPPLIQDLCRRFPPNKLYRLKDTGQKVTIYSYSENNTLTVSVTGRYNLIDFERNVFGVKPADLEECELPDETEIVGVMLENRADIEAHIENLRKDFFGASQ